jgi:hypothetical protein
VVRRNTLLMTVLYYYRLLKWMIMVMKVNEWTIMSTLGHAIWVGMLCRPEEFGMYEYSLGHRRLHELGHERIHTICLSITMNFACESSCI